MANPPLSAGLAGLAPEGAAVAALAGGPAAAAIKLFTEGLQQATGAMEGFVGALAPGALEQFNLAVTELMATVGQALLPAFEALTGVVRQIADAIAPLMKALAPVLKELADIFSTLLLGAVYALVGIFAAIGEALGGTTDALKSFKDGLMDFVRFMLRGLAYLIKAFAGVDAIKAWADAVKGVGARAELAPKGATVTGLAEISKSISSAAFTAGGGTDIQEDMRDFQKKIAEDLEDVKNNGKTFTDWVEKELVPAIERIFDAVLGRFFRRLGEAAVGGARRSAAAGFSPVAYLQGYFGGAEEGGG